VPIERIAILRALQLGDLLTAVPAFRSLRSGFPEAEITLIGLPWAAEFTDRFAAYLDRFVPFPGYPGIDEVPFEAGVTRRFLEEQRRYCYDLALQMHGNGVVSNVFTAALGARITGGLYPEGEPHQLTVGAPYPDDLPEVMRNLRVAEIVGAPKRGTWLEFPLSGKDRSEAAALLSTNASERLIGIHAGARDPARRWDPVGFARVADHLATAFDARIVLTGTRSEAETVRQVASAMRAPRINLAGKSSLGGLAAVIARLTLLISNDSGPAHVADALGVPSVTIFGPADPRRWASLDQGLHPLLRRPVDAERVIAVATRLLQSQGTDVGDARSLQVGA
jgi:ADP-heptose:LPS heptosyltransferase